jgi:carbon storage regulator
LKVLVLARREGEVLVIGEEITVKVLSVTGKIVRLGFDAPEGVRIERYEVALDREKPDNDGR